MSVTPRITSVLNGPRPSSERRFGAGVNPPSAAGWRAGEAAVAAGACACSGASEAARIAEADIRTAKPEASSA